MNALPPIALVVSLLAAGCGGSNKPQPTPSDLAMSTDLATDMAASDGCTTMTFPSDPGSLVTSETAELSEGYDWVDQIGSLIDNGDSTVNVMQYGYWHMTGAAQPSLPHTVTLPSSTTFSACVDCLAVSLSQPADELGNAEAGSLYFAQAGSITASALDHAGATGNIAVTGSSIRLVHWQLGAGVDQAAQDGKCIDVASFDFNSQYDNSTPDL